MTSIAPAQPVASPVSVEWRTLNRDLWVGRRDGRPVGTVEHGRRFVALGVDGELLGAYRTLEEAQAAVAAPEGHEPRMSAPSRSWTGLTFVALVSVPAAVLLGVYAFLVL